MSPDDSEAARLFHGTNIEGLRGIRKTGKINSPAYFTPERSVAEDYARGGPVISVEVPENKLNIDYESKNWGDFIDDSMGEDTVANALRDGAAVYAIEDIPVGGGKFYYRGKTGYLPVILGLTGSGAYGLMGGDNDAEASTATNLEKALVRDTEASAKPKAWAKDAGSNTPNVAQAVAPSDPFTPSPSQLATTAALVAALKSKDAPLEDTYQPADMLTAFATGGGSLAQRLAQAGLDPIFSAGMEYLPRVADAINPRNIVMGLMR
jgi:hypothetical protein